MKCYKCNFGYIRTPLVEPVKGIYQFDVMKCDICKEGKISLWKWIFRSK